MSHLKRAASGHLMHGPNGHLANECGGDNVCWYRYTCTYTCSTTTWTAWTYQSVTCDAPDAHTEGVRAKVSQTGSGTTMVCTYERYVMGAGCSTAGSCASAPAAPATEVDTPGDCCMKLCPACRPTSIPMAYTAIVQDFIFCASPYLENGGCGRWIRVFTASIDDEYLVPLTFSQAGSGSTPVICRFELTTPMTARSYNSQADAIADTNHIEEATGVEIQIELRRTTIFHTSMSLSVSMQPTGAGCGGMADFIFGAGLVPHLCGDSVILANDLTAGCGATTNNMGYGGSITLIPVL